MKTMKMCTETIDFFNVTLLDMVLEPVLRSVSANAPHSIVSFHLQRIQQPVVAHTQKSLLDRAQDVCVAGHGHSFVEPVQFIVSLNQERRYLFISRRSSKQTSPGRIRENTEAERKQATKRRAIKRRISFTSCREHYARYRGRSKVVHLSVRPIWF